MGALAAALMLSPFAAQAMPVADDAPYSIDRTLVTTKSAADGHAYRLFIAWPEGTPPATGWPVLYLLDGADNFAVATTTARRLARAGARSGVSPGVIVGIDSGLLARRVLDYTPSTPGWTIPAGAPASGLDTGGAAAFLMFIERDVKPLVASRWSVDPARQTLAGHSFGGLLSLHARFTRPDIATRYAAISPSLWFGANLIAREEQAAKTGHLPTLIAVGANERGPDAAGGAAAEALARRIDASFFSLSGQDHGTTMLAAMGQIIKLAFGQAD